MNDRTMRRGTALLLAGIVLIALALGLALVVAGRSDPADAYYAPSISYNGGYSGYAGVPTYDWYYDYYNDPFYRGYFTARHLPAPRPVSVVNLTHVQISAPAPPRSKPKPPTARPASQGAAPTAKGYKPPPTARSAPPAPAGGARTAPKPASQPTAKAPASKPPQRNK